MQPALSVIIACRDAENTLSAQLSALSTQVCDVPWEVVVCDNGSADGTVALAQSFAGRLPSLRVVDASDRRGAGHARNVGAASTLAPLLAFCDADDVVAPGWVTAMIGGLRRHRFIAGRFDAHRLNPAAVVASRPLQQDHDLQYSPFGLTLPHAGGGNLGVHRSVFQLVGGFDPQVPCLEDTDLCWRIQLAGVPLVFWPDAVLHVRLRSSLRGIWRQGRNYGAAAALLGHRYPRPPAISIVRPGERPAGRAGRHGPGVGGPAARVLRLPRKLARLAGEQPNLSGFVWSLGWHVGHRGWHPPSTTPATLSPVTPAPSPVSPVSPVTPLIARGDPESGLAPKVSRRER